MINGLFCKVLNLVPRHREIVGNLLGLKYANSLTLLIGFLEIAMAIWILSNIRSRLNAILQIVIIATMNVIECIAVPHLLLWGYYNGFFAFLFILLIYYNEFYLNSKPVLNQ
ncbi:DoxX-like family protein [Flavitalea sp.]